jgi:hypothetical protein
MCALATGKSWFTIEGKEFLLTRAQRYAMNIFTDVRDTCNFWAILRAGQGQKLETGSRIAGAVR